MARYTRLHLMEREEVSRLWAAGASLRQVARTLGRAPSTLSRELQRTQVARPLYRAVLAQQRATRWAHRPRKPRKLAQVPRLRSVVFTWMAQHWSPGK